MRSRTSTFLTCAIAMLLKRMKLGIEKRRPFAFNAFQDHCKWRTDTEDAQCCPPETVVPKARERLKTSTGAKVGHDGGLTNGCCDPCHGGQSRKAGHSLPPAIRDVPGQGRRNAR